MKQRGLFALIMTSLILAAGYDAHGQTTFVWNNTGSNYFSPNSWTNNVAPSGDSSATTSSVLFSNIAVGNNTVSITNTNTVQSIIFSSTANPYTFVEPTNSTFWLSLTVGITNSSTVTQTFNNKVAIKSNSIWSQASGGSMVFNTNVRTASPVSSSTKSLTLMGGGTFDFKASLTHDASYGNNTGVGGQLIVSNSGGTVNLRALNTLGGGIKVSGGTVNLYASGSTGTGPLELASASSTVNVWDNNAISSSSSLVGASTYPTLDFKAAGNVTLNSYGVSSSSAGGSMNFTNSSGSSKTVTFTNADNYITQTLAGARGLSIKSADLTLDFAGNIQNSSTQTNTTTFDGAGNFIVRGSLLDTTNSTGIRTIAKTGAGTLTLQGASNNYSGSTLVGGGTLEVGVAGVLPVASSITVSNGATLRFNKSSNGVNVGPLAVAGTLEQNLITITSSGAVNLTGSTLKVNGTPTLASYTLVSGASLTGNPTLYASISDYALRISENNLLLEKVVTDAYALYLSNNNLPAGTAFNAIIDGVTVGLKYAFASANGMPQNNGVTAVPVIAQLPNGDQQMTYTFDVKDDSPPLTVTYQTSTDLVTWTTTQAVSAGTGAAPAGFLKKQVQVTGSDRLFVRLNVTR
jgi:autotransporter-associated beta strand protein